MRRFAGAVGLCALAICAGCSRFTVQSSHDPAASFHALKTYAWKPGPQPSLGDPRVSDTLVDTVVHSAVDRELTAKGFTKSSAGNADCLLAYDAGVDIRTSTVAVRRSFNAVPDAWGTWTDIHTSDFESGTIILMVADPQAKLMWEGVATGIFDPTATRAQREERITEAIHKLLKQFPPQ